MPIDNVGVQYGLSALQGLQITPAQFVDLNAKIGGLDIDINPTAKRIAADEPALANAYRSGMINETNNLDRTAIIDCRGPDPGAAHDSYRAFAIRARLDREHGTHANQLIWEGPAPIVGDTQCADKSLIAMDRWLTAVEKDRSHKPLAQKVIADKPADLGDECFDGNGNKVSDGLCPPGVVPVYGTPRTVAGDAITTDANKCRLKPLRRSDYTLPFTDAKWAKLQKTFPDGVCDFTKPAVDQGPTIPWLTYQNRRGHVIYGGRPLETPPPHKFLRGNPPRPPRPRASRLSPARRPVRGRNWPSGRLSTVIQKMEASPQIAFQAPLAEANGNGAGPSAGRGFVRDFTEGDSVAAVFAVRERSRLSRRNGDDFLKLMVADRTGSVEAVAWEDVDALFELTAPGSIVRIEGPFSVHPQYGAKITIKEIRPAAPSEFDAADLTEASPTPVDRLEADLRDLIATVQNPQLRALLDSFLAPDSATWERFRDAPAAKYYHQAYRHGLLEHSLSVAQAVGTVASAFPGIDRDVAVTGALLHDIGKTEAYNDDPLAIDLTDVGKLLGEIPLGYYLVRREIERIEGFEPATAQAILHIVLSHHGTLANGSPVVPATREATLVHAIDNLGGKLGSFDRIERELPDGESWSRFDRALEGSAYFGPRAA